MTRFAFQPPTTASLLGLTARATQPTSLRRPRRTFLRFALLSAVGALLPVQTSRAAEQSDRRNHQVAVTEWSDEDLCQNCRGRGKQPCPLCGGNGIFAIDDSVVQQSLVCPNCSGAGAVRCPACIGLGLADTRGILRNGARDGTLRMLRNGSYEILDCSAFPACSIYGVGRVEQKV